MRKVIFILFLIVGLCSCNKSETPKSWEWFINSHKQSSEQFTVTAGIIDTIEGNDKLNLIIDASEFHFIDSTHANGNITVVLKDVIKRKDIIYEELFTSFLAFDTVEFFLNSKGMFKVDFFSEGKRVYPDSNITFFWKNNYDATNCFFYQLNPYKDSVWRNINTPSFFSGGGNNNSNTLVGGSLGEDLFSDTLSWVNFDIPLFGPAPRRTITVGISEANYPVSGYLVLHNYLSIVKLKPHGCTNCFIVENVPNNADASILVVGYNHTTSQYYLSRKDTIVNSDIDISATFNPISDEDLESEIESLN